MMSTVDAERSSGPTLDEIRTWPATVTVPVAGRAWGLSRNQSYDLVRRGEFPATVNRVGGRYRVVTESIIRALSSEPENSAE